MVANQEPAAVRTLGREEARRFLGRHLRGDGVEVGPRHLPCPLPPGARDRYVDRWHPDENSARFPELGATAFPAPDVAVNFDVERLAPLGDRSCDFVVCSHVIEHLAEPIGFLEDIHRVLRPGGAALLLVPDRHRTFDAAREATTLAHLAAEHAAGVTAVDDEHLVDFLTKAGEGASYLGVPEDAEARARWFAWHRERSIHVHCWSQDEFPEVIAYTIRALGLTWELVDALATDAEGPAGAEFGYVLRRSPLASPPARLADRFVAEWSTWADSGRPVFTRPPVAVRSRATLVVDAPASGATVGPTFLVGGWAVDEGRGADPGIDVVETWAVGANGAEHFLGAAPTGGQRPDVAAAVGARGRNAGYTLTVTGLPPGPYDLVVSAHSTARHTFVAVHRRPVIVA